MNTRHGITAKKNHLRDSKIFWSEKNNAVMVKINSVDTACNRHTQNQLKMVDFMNEYKSSPEACCATCVNKMKQLVERFKKLNNQKTK
jgi:hypothetical protein